MRNKTLTVLVTSAALVAGMLIGPGLPFANALGTLTVNGLTQCENGGSPSTATNCDAWIGSVLNATHNHYREDQSVPQRAQLTATDTSDYAVNVTYDVINHGDHAYDSLATWNVTQTTADPCQGLTGAFLTLCQTTTPTTFQMQSDPTPLGPVGAGISNVTSAHELPATSRQWTIYGGTITAAATIVNPGTTATATITLHDNTVGGPMILLFGGHLAVGGDASVV